MSEDKLLELIKNYVEQGSEKSYDEALRIINENLGSSSSRKVKVELEKIKKEIKIKKLNIELDKTSDNELEKKINLHGRIIKLYKELEKKEKNQNEKMKYRLDRINEIKRHKDFIKDYKNNPHHNISLSKKIGLTVKELGDTINIFLKEKDIIKKFGNFIKETTKGAIGSLTLVFAFDLIFCPLALLNPIGIITSASMIPIFAYIGLSAIIRNLFNKTSFERFEYQNSDEYKKQVEKFLSEHKVEMNSISKDLQIKEKTDNIEEVIEINERLISKFDELGKQIKDSELKSTFSLQTLSFFRENKDYCEELKNRYLDEIDDDVEKYKENNKKLMKINLEIFKRENSIKESLKYGGKNIFNSLKVMLVAKAILSYFFPETFNLKDINALLQSFSIIVINGILDIPSYKEKLKYKQTEYEGKVKMRNMKRIERIIDKENETYRSKPNVVYA